MKAEGISSRIFRPLLCGVCLALSGMPAVIAADANPPIPSDRKAELVLLIAIMTSWPTNALPGNSPFVLGVLKDEEVFVHLEQFVRTKPLYRSVTDRAGASHTVSVARVTEPQDAARCHLLYVGASGLGAWSRISGDLQGANLLTVSDAPEFHQRGGIIGLVTERQPGNINAVPRYNINYPAARRANLNFNLALLQKAKNASEILRGR